MWRETRQLRSAILLTVLIVWLIPSLGFAQEGEQSDDVQVSEETAVSTSPSTADMVFEEIELSPEGVTAYDSAGNQWIYDFDIEEFVAGFETRGDEAGGRTERRGRDEIEPVETRCTERKTVDMPALKAVYVGRDEYVDGDIVAYGRVTVKGWVKGNVHSIHRTVLVTASGRVDGDIKAPEIEIKPGGIVRGEVIETPPYTIPIDLIDDQLSTAGIWVVFSFTLALSLIVFLASALAPRQMNNMTDCVRQYPVRSLLYGLLLVVGMPAITFLIAITIVGITVVWLLPIAYLVALGMGMAATGYQVTGPLLRRHAGIELGSMATSMAGVFMFMAVWALVAILLGAGPSGQSGFRAFGIPLLVFAILGSTYPLFTGTGAAFLTRFGFREYIAKHRLDDSSTQEAPAPAPPPIPEGPPRVHQPPVLPSERPDPTDKPSGPLSGTVGE